MRFKFDSFNDADFIFKAFKQLPGRSRRLRRRRLVNNFFPFSFRFLNWYRFSSVILFTFYFFSQAVSEELEA